MALPPREIRYNKRALYPFIAILIFVLFTTGFTLLSSGAPLNRMVLLSFGGSFLIIGAVLYPIYQRIKSDQPVITFAYDRLILHSKNKVIFWSSIIDWKIRRDKSNYTLVIRTANGKTRVSLGMLDHTSKDIKWLMESYIRQPGPRVI